MRYKGQNSNSSASIARALVAALNRQLPAIFDRTPEMICPAHVIAEFAVHTFLENIAVDAQGLLFVTSYEEGKIYQVTPDVEHREFASIDGNVAGIAVDGFGNLLVAGSTKDKIPTIFRIDPTGSVEPIIALPEAIFLNGMTHLQGDRYLVADSYKGAIWDVDVNAKTARIWIQDNLLTRSDTSNPFPAVNGIKIYQNSLFASNTQRQLLVRIPFTTDSAPGTPEVFLTNVNLDDFAFDARGNLYGTTMSTTV
jgi:sugar lactone lactonase YvrE